MAGFPNRWRGVGDALAPADRVSLDLFVHQRVDEVAFQAFEGWRTMSLGSRGGFHTALPAFRRGAFVTAHFEGWALYAETLGFDLRRFHDAVLGQGALPLPVLQRVVDDWIAAQRAGAR
ncbi:hypothetical protein [Azohydromonas sp.]|uniref:hypothetical protein n=1 Tax=Azohydromonas sp. TaxID=1872666 RepID=UPI002D1DEA4E|nr:hypothetical protein [Azohydromonas sp.]HMM84814.1 hypothetical protein [Azohydromonas sp.]